MLKKACWEKMAQLMVRTDQYKKQKIGAGSLCNLLGRISLCFVLLLCLLGKDGDGEQNYQRAEAVAYNAPIIKTVRVGYVEAPCFMQGMRDDAVKSGLAYDYLQRISYYTNWRYVYVYGDWATILDKLYKGEVDVMAGVSKTPERDRLLWYKSLRWHKNYGFAGIKQRTKSSSRRT